MILEVEESVELELPTGWRELPPAPVLENEDWLWEWVECTEPDCDRREALAEGMRQVAGFARIHDRDGRVWAAVIDDARREVTAVAAFSTRLAEEDVPVPAFFTPGSEPWSRRVAIRTTRRGRLVSVHDIVMVPARRGSVLTERFVGTLTPVGRTTAVQLTVIALSLDSFVDIVAEGERALERLRLV